MNLRTAWLALVQHHAHGVQHIAGGRQRQGLQLRRHRGGEIIERIERCHVQRQLVPAHHVQRYRLAADVGTLHGH